MANKQILVTVSGPDQPGITSKLMRIIVNSNFQLVDVGQSVTHGLLSLSLLIGMNGSTEVDRSPILKDLLFEAKNLGLGLEFKILEQDEMDKEVATPGDKFILSCVSNDRITAAFMADISYILATHNVNIHRIDNVTGGNFKSIEITTIADKSVNFDGLKEELISTSNKHQIDIAFLKENIFRRNKRLIIFDMDSTLIQSEVIDEMAKVYGVGDEISKVTEQAMNGEIDFDESLKLRVSKLKGMKTSDLQQILENLPLTPGVEEFIKTVKKLGYKVGVISGGFTYFAHALKNKLGLDYAFANELEIQDGKLTGKVKGTIINAEQKALLVDLITQQENITLEQVVAIGDGANDLKMLSKAGLGIAFHAKEIVKKKAQNQMSHGPMTTVLYFLGITDHEY